MFQFSELYGFPNSTTRTVHGTAASGFTFDTSTEGSTFDNSSVFALVGSSFTNQNDLSTITYEEDAAGNWAATTLSFGGASSTDSGNIGAITSTDVGTTTDTVLTQTSRETTQSTTGSTVFSVYNTRAKTSTTQSYTVKSTHLTTVGTSITALGMTDTSSTTGTPPPPWGIRVAAYADTAAGEVLLIPKNVVGVVWAGNGFDTATSTRFFPPAPLGNGEITASNPPSVSSSTAITNPGNGLTWHSVSTLTSSLGLVQGTFDSTKTTSTLSNFPATILVTAGGDSYDDTTLVTDTDFNYGTTTETITVTSTISDYLFQISNTSDTSARFLSVVTSVTTTFGIPALVALSAKTTESSTFSTTDSTTKTGTPSTRAFTISSSTVQNVDMTYSTWNGSYANFVMASNQLQPGQRVLVLPMGGWQLADKAGAGKPIYSNAPEIPRPPAFDAGQPETPQLLMFGGVLVDTQNRSIRDGRLLPAAASRMTSFGAGGGTVILGAPVLRTANPEIEKIPFGGAFVYASGGESTSFINSNLTTTRTDSVGGTTAYETINMSTVQTASGESNPGELPGGEIFRSQSMAQNL